MTSNSLLKNHSLFFVLFSFIINACNIDLMHKVDQPVITAKTIGNSKELGVFLGEYYPLKVKINDTIQFNITQAWVEYNFYYSDLENPMEANLQMMKLKKDFTPINGAHVSFIVHEDLTKKYDLYNCNSHDNKNDNWWEIEYYNISNFDTLFKDRNTYLESYGPVDYQNLPDSIAVKLNHYISPLDSTKYGSWVELARIYLIKKEH